MFIQDQVVLAPGREVAELKQIWLFEHSFTTISRPMSNLKKYLQNYQRAFLHESKFCPHWFPLTVNYETRFCGRRITIISNVINSKLH